MAVSVTITSIINEAAPAQGNQPAAAFVTNRILVNFDDGSQREFPDLDSFQLWARELETADTAQRMACARLVALSPTLTNTNQVVGKTCTLDFASVSVFKVQ